MLLLCNEINMIDRLTPAHFIAFYGVITTFVIVWNFFKRSKVYGKVISKVTSLNGTFNYTNEQKQPESISGQLYMLKLSLSCLRKTLHYTDVTIFVTYGKEKIKAQIYYLKYFKFNNTDDHLSGKKMKTPAKEFLTFNNVLEEGKTTFYYLNFIVPNRTGDSTYDKLELEFIKPNKRTLKVNIAEIDQKQFLLDDELLENQ